MKQTRGRLTRDGAEVRRVQVMLDEITIERAKALGDGNVSQGIRTAVKESAEQKSEANEMGALKTITIYAAGWYSAAAGRCESGVFDGRIEFPQALHAPLFDLLCEEAMEHERFEPREKWMRAARGLGFKMEAFARSAGLSLPRGDWLISPMYDAAYVHWGMGVV